MFKIHLYFNYVSYLLTLLLNLYTKIYIKPDYWTKFDPIEPYWIVTQKLFDTASGPVLKTHNIDVKIEYKINGNKIKCVTYTFALVTFLSRFPTQSSKF